jgi:2-polyprenyl-3-methyl-5-hydroxy-6-metoxy-1,4-benzoquinol methylase
MRTLGKDLMLRPAIDREALRRQVYRLNFGLKPRHRRRFRHLNAAAFSALKDFTRAHYTNLSDEGDLDAALAGRLHEDRSTVVPWLDAALRLDGARILEIGCGTGESTLALAEQGALVTGVDVDPGALAVGRERVRLHGLSADFVLANAAEVGKWFAGQTFDMVIFFAALEHMTLDERLTSMADTWNLTRPGGVWSVIEAPNRLWFWDGHTSMENFYNWLPDEVASKWAHRARRAAFAEVFPKDRPLDHELLSRWGRGVSFHEFDLVMGDAKRLDVISNKRDFLVRSNPILYAHSLVSRTRRYERFLESLEPEIDPGFFRQYLDLAIRKG